MPPEKYAPGLEGVIAGETAISTITDGLRYRGFLVTELAEQVSYDEVAYLLLHGDLPTTAQLSDFHTRVAAARRLPELLSSVLRSLPPGTAPMDVVRTSTSILAHFDPESGDNSPAATLGKAERLLGQLPVAVAEHARIGHGLPPVSARADLGHAASFLYSLRGREAQPEDVRAFDVSLTLYAEHEFNASTFAARVICSTESDLHSSIIGAIGALKGRLHGGANEQVMDLLRAAGGPHTAEKWVREQLARKQKVMGFGHRVYKDGDVRATILTAYTRRAAEVAKQLHWEETATVIERVMEQEKKLRPNLDWPAGRLYHALGLEVPLYTPIFVLARVAGWAAHVLEQQQQNRLIRPRSLYVGPGPRPVVPLAARQ